MNGTDPESQIRPVSGGGLEQAYNAQAGVAHGRRLSAEHPVSPHPNDPQERPPALDHLSPLPAALGQVTPALTDRGYCSEAHVKAGEQAGIIPLLARGRAGHHPTLEERFADPGEAPTAINLRQCRDNFLSELDCYEING